MMDQSSAAILARLEGADAASSIDDVLSVMQGLDAVLPEVDGVKWFNLLYLMVTKAIHQQSVAGWADAGWLTRLDVLFARLYFDALARWYTAPDTTPRAWQALFEARYQPGVERVQFALAGMNAHINHDLPIAVVQTCVATAVIPERDGPQFADFEAVNAILSQVEPQALQHLATGIVGMIAQDLGAIGHVLSMWSVEKARDTAWTNAQLGWQVRDLPSAREQLLLVLDRLTGFAGRGLLVPLI